MEAVTRKEFIKKCATLTCAASLSYIGLNTKSLYAAVSQPGMIAVRGSTPDKMFDAAMKQTGLLSSIVTKGKTVVVKPNIGWDKKPEEGANTNPLLIKRIVEHCYAAGAKRVYVFDNSCSYWESAYKNSGIEKAAKEGGATVAPGDSSNYYQEVDIPGKKLKKAAVHELILDADIVINVPILKNHMATTMTGAMKNLMGAVYDRGYYHRNNLHQCIADFLTFRKPDLNIVDAYVVMEKNGPRGISKKDLVIKKMQLISRDIVTIDAAAAKILGHTPDKINHITIGDTMNIGSANLDAISIQRIVL